MNESCWHYLALPPCTSFKSDSVQADFVVSGGISGLAMANSPSLGNAWIIMAFGPLPGALSKRVMVLNFCHF